jgi:hypothetical protein
LVFESRDWPDFVKLLQVINAPSSFFLSFGCEVALSSTNHSVPSYRTKLTSYVGIAFEVLELNRKDRSYYDLIDRFTTFTDGIATDDHSVVCFEVQQTNYCPHGLQGWSMVYFSTGLGDTESAATSAWLIGIQKFQEFILQESERNKAVLQSSTNTVSGMFRQ